MSSTESALWAAGIAAAATIAAVLIGALATDLTGRSVRRRAIYGDALRSVVEWTEMPHRVRRRAAGSDAELVDRFHSIQEDLAYHLGIIGSESKYVARSYSKLVSFAKLSVRDKIKDAWSGQHSNEQVDAVFETVDIDGSVQLFLQDVRSHLSPWPWRKIGLAWRNRAGS